MMQPVGKVFVIGAPKTGTTSAGDALRWMGYRVSSWPVYRLYHCLLARDMAALTAEIDAHDGFEDLPWTVYTKCLIAPIRAAGLS